MNKFILTHSNCQDGTGAQYAAWKKFGDQAIYIPVQYGQPLPEMELDWDSELYILDFSYSREILIELNQAVKKLVVMDHHEPNIKDIGDLPGVTIDTSRSGAVMAWQYFHPETDIPNLLKHVQDRDLWRFEYPDSKNVHAGIRASLDANDMRYWDQLATDKAALKECTDYGYYAKKAEDTFVQSYARRRSSKIRIVMIDGKRVAVYNAVTAISEIGNALCLSENNVDYTMSYFMLAEGRIVFNFRSTKASGVNVSDIAKQYGGKGHPNAAGASVPMERGFEILKDLHEREDLCRVD